VSNPVANALAIKELRDRALVTLGLIFAYRLGCQVPVPGVNHLAMQALMMHNQQGGMLGVLLFSGGALSQFSVFGLGGGGGIGLGA
jgi:preprotein translocase subunit SecY